jgi:DnaJ-domain-containing protein 1
MSIPERIYNLAKGHLDKALQRWDEIDSRAQQELDSYMANQGDTNNMSAWDRAVGKINSAGAEKELRSAADRMDDTPPPVSLDALESSIAAERAATSSGSRNQPVSAARMPQTLIAAYKVLGVDAGADWLTVQKAYQELRERAAPDRFPAGSKEQEAAKNIQKRIESAYMMLSSALAPATDRFDRLEL